MIDTEKLIIKLKKLPMKFIEFFAENTEIIALVVVLYGIAQFYVAVLETPNPDVLTNIYKIVMLTSGVIIITSLFGAIHYLRKRFVDKIGEID